VTDAFRLPPIDDIVAAALAEDFGVPPEALLEPTPGLLALDVTGSLLPLATPFHGVVRPRSAGVVCGLPVVARVFEMLAAASGFEPPDCFPLAAEGATVVAGQPVLEVDGGARLVLAGERTALDFLMVLSGIATVTARWQAAAGPVLNVVDTRKTLPGLRALSKYAVRVGGGMNHRMGLHDMVLIKDNHIAAAGGATAAIERARRVHPHLLVEVEADTVEQAAEAAAAGADMVLLDNMDDATLAAAVQAVRGATPEGRHCLAEASGGITVDRVAGLAALGLDRVSASALTLAPPLDFGFDERVVHG
jgi:nicotinate-nucleotide pyrophosphorylase (carboxylating)